MKKQYRTILFDLDGTLADTSQGIYNCHRYAISCMGITEPIDRKLEGIIGAPLLESYRTRFGFSDESARIAASHYRKRYAEKGIFEAELYKGIRQLLEGLQKNGYYLGVASLKAEPFVISMMEHWGISDYFSVLRGVDDKDKYTKADLLRFCMQEINSAPEDTILVGDSSYDGIGAKETQIDFLAVTYGLGFRKRDEAEKFNPVYVANTVTDLFDFFKISHSLLG
jgi:phosphoglycolate phosphatase